MDLSLREAAKLFSVPEAKLAKWIADEGLPAYMINGRYRFNRVDLLEWANSRRIPAPALYRLPEGDLGALDALLEGNIHHGVPGADKAAVMAAVAERLPLAGPAEKALAAQALAEREAHGATIIDGIALPHARSPLVFGVERPVLALCFLAQTVPFGPDGAAPVRVVWALVSPTVRAHLALLAKVAAALHDAEFRALLDRRAPAPELLAALRRLA